MPDWNWRALTHCSISLKRASPAPLGMKRITPDTGRAACAMSLASDRHMVPGVSCASNQ
ncbi:hypothetical protein D9M72_587630 [compost metagenome]